MEQHIRTYIEELFIEAPVTRKAAEMKLELTENLIEKYQTLLSEKMPPEEAYNVTVQSIGDIKELFFSLQDEPLYHYGDSENYKRQSAWAISIAVMMYILSIVPLVLFGGKFSLVLMLLIVAAATGLIVYVSMTKPKVQNLAEGSIVADFRDWQDRNLHDKQIKKSLYLVLWTLVLIVYFLVSFATMYWWITWLIFPLGVAIQGVISILFSQRNIKR